MGQLKSSLTCSACGYCSTAFDPFWDLSLPIAKVTAPRAGLADLPAPAPPLPSSSPALAEPLTLLSLWSQKGYGEVNLIDCMRLFTKEDILDGDEKPVRARHGEEGKGGVGWGGGCGD